MGERTISVPGDGRFCTAAEAGKYLGCSEDTFERLVAAETWIREIRIGRKVMYDPLDVFVLAHLLQARSTAPKSE